MSRVDELQKRYPSLPRDFIVRWDTRAHGINDNPKLDDLGTWVRLAGVGTYSNYDYDISMKDWVSMPERFKDGQVLRPGNFLPASGLFLTNGINTKSDLQIRGAEEGGKFALYQGDERVEELYYVPAKAKGEYVNSKGIPESNYVTWMNKYCFLIMPVRHCEYFPLGKECKFCNFNPSQEDSRSIGLNRTTAINLEDTLDAYKRRAGDLRLVEGRLELGGFTKSEQESKIHYDFIEKVAHATAHKPNITIHTQPAGRKDLQRLKDGGLDSLSFQMEIWDPELFPEVVPGKSQYTGRERYLEYLQEAVEVFGQGNVGCVFVGGVSMIPEKGHKTWQEARDSTIEGNNWCIKHGILPVMTWLRLPPGSPYGTDEKRRKAPPTEYYLEVAIAHHETSKEYGLYDFVNRLMWCPLDCLHGPYSGELGAHEIAGSVGNWAATVVPREANFILDWEEQFKAMAKTQ